MEFEKNTNDSKDNFMDTLEKNYFLEEITQLKICLEEIKIAIDNLRNQLMEKEKHNEKLECEIVILRKELEKVKTLNPGFAKGSKTLDEIIKVQCSPLMKTGLGYIFEYSQTEKSLATSYLNATKSRKQIFVTQKKKKDNVQVKHDHSNPRMNNNTNISKKVKNTRRFYDCINFFFNGQCFSCHKFGYKAAQCVAYKTIMTR